MTNMFNNSFNLNRPHLLLFPVQFGEELNLHDVSSCNQLDSPTLLRINISPSQHRYTYECFWWTFAVLRLALKRHQFEDNEDGGTAESSVFCICNLFRFCAISKICKAAAFFRASKSFAFLSASSLTS